MISLFLSLSVLILFIGFIVARIRKHRNLLHAISGIGSTEKHWFWGHGHRFTPYEAGIKEFIEAAKKFPKCMQRWFGPIMVTVIGYHPHFVKTVLTTNEPKIELFYGFLRSWIGDGLLLSSGRKWKRNRRLLTPAFHFDALKTYLKCTNNSVTELTTMWSQNMEGGVVSVDVFKDIGMMTLDHLLRCIYSKNTGFQNKENQKYLKNVGLIAKSVIARTRNPFLMVDWIFHISPIGRRYKIVLDEAHEFTTKAIDERKLEMKKCLSEGTSLNKNDFLNILLSAQDENGVGLNDDEIRDELDTFVFEGHDTVSSGISWALYNLAKYPSYQEKCREEVLGVLMNRDTVTWEDLPKLQFVTMFLKESMRLYPPVLGVGRQLTKPMHFSRCFGSDQFNLSQNSKPTYDASGMLPSNLPVVVDLIVLHRNPSIWEDPEKFDPERFSVENVAKRSPHAYLPFSSGPRNCIGQNFAMNEMKITLALVLKRYRIEIDESYPQPIMEGRLVLHSVNGIHLKLKNL